MRKRTYRRPPSDERALKGYTDPGIVKAVCLMSGLVAVLMAGVALLVRAF